jgi:hypothetical protein
MHIWLQTRSHEMLYALEILSKSEIKTTVVVVDRRVQPFGNLSVCFWDSAHFLN